MGNLPDPTGFESPTGKGIRGEIDGKIYYTGKPALFEKLGFDLSRVHRETDGGVVSEEAAESDDGVFAEDALGSLEREGKTVVLVGTESKLLGAIAIVDEVYPASKRAVERLHELGVERVVI